MSNQAGQPGQAARQALELIRPGSVVGLGTGRAATGFVYALGERVRQGLAVRGIATSEATAELARKLRIPLVGFESIETVDVTVDGADEVDPELNLIKGRGGALVREKVVASVSQLYVILVGSEKLVPALGTRGVLPVEIVPFARYPCQRQLEKLGFPASLREENGKPLISDNGNYILDATVRPLPDPAAMHEQIRALPGVIDTGLFLDMADLVLIERAEQVEVLKRGGA